MSRWNSVSLMMMGVSVIALSACDEPKVDAAVFKSLQQCIDDSRIPRDQCEESFGAARTSHTEVAPKYSSRNDCESDFGSGKCERAPDRTRSGDSVFMPMMMGYLMGSSRGGGASVVPQPLYRSADDPSSYRTADNKKVGSTTGQTQVASSAAGRPSAKTSTIARGGFGATGARVGTSAT